MNGSIAKIINSQNNSVLQQYFSHHGLPSIKVVSQSSINNIVNVDSFMYQKVKCNEAVMTNNVVTDTVTLTVTNINSGTASTIMTETVSKTVTGTLTFTEGLLDLPADVLLRAGLDTAVGLLRLRLAIWSVRSASNLISSFRSGGTYSGVL
mgnify:CR=1 FL=1